MAVLQVVEGLNPGQVFPLEQEQMVMGRHPDCDIVLADGAVSRYHAKMSRVGDDFYVEDLGSRNGTFVNGQKIEGQHRLDDRDRLKICDLEFTYLAQGIGGGGPGEESATWSGDALLVDDREEDRGMSTVMSRVDVTVGDRGLRIAVKPEAKLEAMFELTQALRRAMTLDDVLERSLDSLFKIFVQADRGFVVIKQGDRLVPQAVRQRRPEAETIRISQTIVRQVMDTKAAILSKDAASDERFDMSQSIADFPIRSMMCAPLLDSEGNALGVIQIDAINQNGNFGKDDLDVLVAAANTSAFAIENVQLHEMALRQQAVERDLELAHAVQRGLLPSQRPLVEGYEFFDFYDSAKQVGGDYFSYFLLPDGRVAVVLADVSGKGVAAALMMAKLTAEVRVSVEQESDAGAALTRLNVAVSRDCLEGMFVTLALVVIDPKSHQVTVANAGHMAPFLRHKNGSVEAIGEEEVGVPLGIVPDFSYDSHSVELSPGDMVSVYTDGISEAMNAAGDQFGSERIAKALSADLDSTEALGEHLLDCVRAFVGKEPQLDDMCLVCCGRK